MGLMVPNSQGIVNIKREYIDVMPVINNHRYFSYYGWCSPCPWGKTENTKRSQKKHMQEQEANSLSFIP